MHVHCTLFHVHGSKGAGGQKDMKNSYFLNLHCKITENMPRIQTLAN